MKIQAFRSSTKRPRQVGKQWLAIIISCVIMLTALNYSMAQTTEAYNWSNVAMGGGGFVSGIITSKTAGGPIYARTDVGGAYRWDATNSKWIPITDFASESQQGVFGTLSLAIDPQQLNVVYILAGISYFNGGNSYIMRSTDYGAHFTVTNITSQFKVNGNALGRQDGERLQVDPNDSAVVYCGTQANGLFRSTNYGSTWSRLTSLNVTTTPNANGVSFVVLDKSSGVNSSNQTKRMFAGISRAGSNQSFYRSDDAGVTFTAIDNPSLPDTLMPQRAVLSGNRYLYITYANGAGPSSNGTETYNAGQIWRYTIANGAWTNVTPISSTNRINKPYCGISIDPFNSAHLIATTTNNYSYQYTYNGNSVYGDKIYFSTDSGSTWTDVVARGFSIDPNGVPWLAGASIHWAGSIEFDPSNTNRIMITSGNGTFINDDITNTAGVWKANVKGIEEVVPRNLVSIPGGPVVTVISDYDGFTQNNPSQYAAQRHTPTMGSTTGLDYAVTNKKVVRVASSMYYSTDMGFTWTKTTATLPGSDGQVALSADGNTYLYCPSGSSTLYRSTNNGGSWAGSTISGVTTTDLRPVADGSTSGTFYVYNGSTTNPGLYITTNGGSTFAKTAGAVASGGSKIIRNVPGYAGDIWIALNGGGLVYTQNAGASFTTVANVTSCASVGIGKAAPCTTYPAVYIWGSISGSANGLYRTFDMGTTWTRVNDDDHEYGGPGNGQFVIGDMNTFGNVYMSTAGRGVAFGTKIPVLDVTPTTLTFSNALGSQTVTPTSTENWTVTDNQTWISVSPTSGCSPNQTSFTVSVTANTGSTTRTGTVTITGGGITRTIEVNQNYSCSPTTITPYVKVNANAWVQTPYASLAVGGTVLLGPQPNVTTGWDWTGPNGFTSTARQLTFTNIQANQAGNYIATYTNSGGCKDSQTFTIAVTGGSLAATMPVETSSIIATDPAAPKFLSPIDNTSAIVAYPNPTTNNVTIKIPAEMLGGSITMRNAYGALLYTGSVTGLGHIINMSQVPMGLYIINVNNNSKSLYTKVIKK